MGEQKVAACIFFTIWLKSSALHIEIKLLYRTETLFVFQFQFFVACHSDGLERVPMQYFCVCLILRFILWSRCYILYFIHFLVPGVKTCDVVHIIWFGFSYVIPLWCGECKPPPYFSSHLIEYLNTIARIRRTTWQVHWQEVAVI